MKRRMIYGLGAALVLLVVIAAFRISAAERGRAVPDILARVQPSPVVVLVGQPVLASDFLPGYDTAVQAVLGDAVTTAFPGRQEVTIVLTDGTHTLPATAYLYILEPARIVDKEIGTIPGTIPASDFFANWDILDAPVDFTLRFVTDMAGLSLNNTGWHDITLMFNDHTFTSTLRIGDTTPPQATPVDITVSMGQAVQAGSFVRDIIDRSPVTVFFKEGHEPDFFAAGEQVVTVILEDAYGNRAESTSTLTVLANLVPPVIHGTRDLEVMLGGSVMYRQGVSAVDYFGNPVSFTIESDVDFHTPGIYTATYIATDASGNTTRQSIAVTVLTVEYEMLNDMLQAVVDRIIREDMTQREMAQAIFTWVSNNIGYVADAPKDTVYDGAFRALQFRSGDCFTYYAISEVLLTRLGIPNIGLERVEGTSTRHYWNLVNADGEGWYHFDTTPTQVRRLDRFMFGEQAAMEYTEIMLNETRTRNYYTYDREALPVEVMP